MKRMFLMLAVLIGLTASATEYQYVPTVREGVEWGYAAYYEGFYQEIPDSTYYYRLQFKGDTVVNGKTYKKLYRYDTATLDTSKCQPYALMREEGKKVYLSSIPISPFDLNFIQGFGENDPLYDFNVTTGGPIGGDNKVLSVSSIEVAGANRNAFEVEYVESYKIIEGMGPIGKYSGNLAYPYVRFRTGGGETYHYLLYERNLDGSIVYKTTDFDDWAKGDPTVVIQGVNGVKKSAARLTCKDGIISLLDAGNGTVMSIYNVDGSLVYQGSENSVAVPHPGVYIVKTANTTQKVVVK